MKVAYIVSSSFSGSTLLSFILNAHPDIGTISEFDTMEGIRNDPDFLCSCGQRIRECPFFVDLKKRLDERGEPFEVDHMDMMLKLHPNPRVHRLLAEKLPTVQSNALEGLRDSVVAAIPSLRHKKERAHRRTEAFMQAILDLQGASVFLDATKNPYRMRFLCERHDVKAIYLFKNGIAGVYSFVKNTRNSATPLDVETASHRWFTEQLTIARCLEQLPADDVVQVAYSDLCADVQGTLERIYQVIGIPSVSAEHFASAEHHIVGNVMRLGNFSEIRESVGWKKKLSEADVETYRNVLRKYEKKLAAANPYLYARLWL